MKKILVATGSSDNKKKFAIDYIAEYFKKKSFPVEVLGENIYEVKVEDIKPDLIVAIGPINFKTEIPIIQGTAFLTKMGMDQVCDKMYDMLK